MLPLPKNLIIDRDLEDEKELLEKTRRYLEAKERDGFHLSDLMDERIAYFRKVTNAPIPNRLLNMFLVGQIAHAFIEVVSTGTGDYTKHDEGTQSLGEIKYSPDIVDHKGGPDEIKTTRSFYLPRVSYLPDDDTYHMYFEQLLGYMALENKTVGRLTILYLNAKGEDGRTQPQFFVWKVNTTDDALAAYRNVLNRKLETLKKAITEGTPKDLPLCRAWKCEGCEFWETCKPEGRYGLQKEVWLPKRAAAEEKAKNNPRLKKS